MLKHVNIFFYYLLVLMLIGPESSGASFSDQSVIIGNHVTTFSETIDIFPPATSLSVTGSWTRAITENITNGDFETSDSGNYLTAGDVSIISSDTILDANPGDSITVLPHSGNYMARIGSDQNSGNFAWDNRLLQSIPSGAKSLSFFYNLFTRDYSPLDNPAFFVRLNGEDVFASNTFHPNPDDEIDELARSTGWQEFIWDLSPYNSDYINLALYAGNTGDDLLPSWVYVDQITTYFVAASAHAVYHLTANDPLPSSGINNCQYDIDNSGWNTNFNFSVPEEGEHVLKYRCSDNAGNTSQIKTVRIVTDNTPPAPVADLSVDDITENSVLLSWSTSGNNNGLNHKAKYDLRFQKNCSNPDNFDYDSALNQSGLPSPSNSAGSEEFEVAGLNQDTDYCAGIKVVDEAPNYSSLSNIIQFTTLSTSDLVSFGDIIINELFWMGSSISSADEWLELKNTTDHDIDISNWYLTKLSSSVETIMYTVPNNTTIPAQGYLVISEYDASHSALKNEPDLIVGSGSTNNVDFALSNSELLITLYTDTDSIIDNAWDGNSPQQGIYDKNANIFYSMERTNNPGDGFDPLSWYSCIDIASNTDFFDIGSGERGTPGSQNRSENEPYNSAGIYPFLRLQVTNGNFVNFTLNNIISFDKFSFELTYLSDSVLQSISGQRQTNNQKNIGVSDLILGTCSDGNCTYQNNVKDINLTVTLSDSNNQLLILRSTPPKKD